MNYLNLSPSIYKMGISLPSPQVCVDEIKLTFVDGNKQMFIVLKLVLLVYLPFSFTTFLILFWFLEQDCPGVSSWPDITHEDKEGIHPVKFLSGQGRELVV